MRETASERASRSRGARGLIAFNVVVSRAEMLLATVCAIAFIGITLMETTGRYFFNYSQLWAAELSALLFIWSVFLASAVCFRSGSHLCVELWNFESGGVADRVQRGLIFLSNMLFIAAFCYYGYQLLMSDFHRSTSVMEIPLVYGWLAPWVMAVSSLFFLLENLVAPGHVEKGLTPPTAV